MSRNGSEMMTALKKDNNFGGFFGSAGTPQTTSNNLSAVEMPASVRFGYMEVREFIEDFDGKVAYAKTTNQEKLKNKVLVDLSRLNREERMVQKLEEKLAKQGIEVNESSMIKKDLIDLQSLEQFSNSMKQASDTIQSQIDQCHARINEMNQTIAQKQAAIRATNSSIMAQSAKKEALLKILRKLKKTQAKKQTTQLHTVSQVADDTFANDNYLTSVPQDPSNASSILRTNAKYGLAHHFHTDQPSEEHSNNFKYKKLALNNNNNNNNISIVSGGIQNVLPDKLAKQTKSLTSLQLPRIHKTPFSETESEIRRIQTINEEIKQYFYKKSNGFLEMKRVVHDCFTSQSKRVAKSHQMSSQQHGLANSMIFEINPAAVASYNTQLFDEDKHVIPRSNLLQQTKLQDRELRNILYDTMKHIKATKISQEDHQASLDRLAASKIPYSEFKEFNGDQILSLLMVRPSLLHQLLAVFDIKEKAMNLMIIKAKILYNRRQNLNQTTSQTALDTVKQTI